MISIVIPTMWYFQPFVRYLNDLVNCNVINDITIIDNRSEHRPDDPVFTNNKIKIIDPGTNIGVNPAWNLGVNNALMDKVVIINDDMIVDLKLFNRLHQFDAPFGFVGLTIGETQFGQDPLIDGSIDIKRFDQFTSGHGSLLGMGTCFMVCKSYWTNIPSSLIYYCGDDWVVNTNVFLGRDNYTVSNCLFFTPGHTTCGNVLGDMDIATQTLEIEEYVKHFNTFTAQKSTFMARQTLYDEYTVAAANINSDIYAHLPRINDLLKDCVTAIEMGVRDGQSSRAFLINDHLKLISYDLYLDPRVEFLFGVARTTGMDCQYVMANTLEIEINEIDLLFIDTDHTYIQLSQELKLHGNKAKKYLVFHDTVTYSKELLPAIFEFMADNPHWKIKQQYSDCNGLTILERTL